MDGNDNVENIEWYLKSLETNKLAKKEVRENYLIFKITSTQATEPIEIRLTPTYEPLYVSYRGYTGGKYQRGEALELDDIKQLTTAYMEIPPQEHQGLFGVSYVFSNGTKFNRQLQ